PASFVDTVLLPAPAGPSIAITRLLVGRYTCVSRQGVEQARELRERRGDALGVFDNRLAVGHETRHGERHRDAVVPGAVDASAVQSGRAVDDEAVRALGDTRAHPPAPTGEREQAARPLHPP